MEESSHSTHVHVTDSDRPFTRSAPAREARKYFPKRTSLCRVHSPLDLVADKIAVTRRPESMHAYPSLEGLKFAATSGPLALSDRHFVSRLWMTFRGFESREINPLDRANPFPAKSNSVVAAAMLSPTERGLARRNSQAASASVSKTPPI